MTEQIILVYELFLLLNIPDFSLFLSKNCNSPLKKVILQLPNNPPLKTESLSRLSLFENLVVGLTSPPAETGEGTHDGD